MFHSASTIGPIPHSKGNCHGDDYSRMVRVRSKFICLLFGRGVRPDRFFLTNSTNGWRTSLAMFVFCFLPLALNASTTPATINSLACSRLSLTGTAEDLCEVTLTEPAPKTGLVVSLSSSYAAVRLPGSVTVAANATTAAFTADVQYRDMSSRSVILKASVGATYKILLMELIPATRILHVSSTTVAFGSIVLNQPATLPLTLQSTGNLSVTIDSATITGSGFTISGVNFPIRLHSGESATLNVHFDPSVQAFEPGQIIFATNSNRGTKTVVNLTGTGKPLAPATIRSLACNLGSINGPGTDSCTVTLTGEAPRGGDVIGLVSSSASVVVPAKVTVPANATSITFAAAVSMVSKAQAVTLTATLPPASAFGNTQRFVLQLQATMTTSQLTTDATSISFGVVRVKSPTTQIVTLKSTGTGPLIITAAKLAGNGFSMSGPTFPLTLNPSQTATVSLEFDPASAGPASGQLALTSNSTTNGTALISLNGTGAFEVDLTWDPPTESPTPVAGYSVFRSADGGNTYQLLVSDLPETAYSDASVVSSGIYDYFVESVDAFGSLSVPSDIFSVLIP